MTAEVAMGFLDSSPALRGTVFSESDLEQARAHLKPLIDELFQGSKNANGKSRRKSIFFTKWSANFARSQCELIALSKQLRTIEKSCSERSRCILNHKVQELVGITDVEKYEEAIVEIEAADLWACLGPIELEPLAGELNAARKQPSPDFLVRSDDTDVLVEVTVFRMEALRKWHLGVDRFFDRLCKVLARSNIRRSLYLSLSLHGVPTLESTDVLRLAEKICASEKGGIALDYMPPEASLQWFGPASMPFVGHGRLLSITLGVVDGQLRPTAHSDGQLLHGCICVRTVTTRDSGRLIGNSMRNTIEAKRDQLSRSNQTLPACVFVAIPQTEIWDAQFMATAAEYAFRDGPCSRISGLALFKRRSGFGLNDYPAAVLCHANPNARFPLPSRFLPS
ncbi:MAG: hypothetical protein QM770_16570 [Tepidisphaeraceae bacterium]